MEHVATDWSQLPVLEKHGDANNKLMIMAKLPMIVQVVENICLTPDVRAQAGYGYIFLVKRNHRLHRVFQFKRSVNGLGRDKRTLHQPY